jgi:CheY-like chemotaxis protein
MDREWDVSRLLWLGICGSASEMSRIEGQRKLVLVVDDNDAEREMYGSLLWYNGFDVAYADTGRTGIDLAHKEHPDLILLDMMLPDIDGLRVCDELKRGGAMNDVPVVALSGRTERELGPAARSVGCIRYLEKPISAIDVLHEVEKLIGRAPPPGDTDVPPRGQRARNADNFSYGAIPRN